MDWLIFAIFFGCNLFTILICQYTTHVDGTYRKGMLLGVHIPSYEVQSDRVQTLCLRCVKKWKRYYKVSLILGTITV